MKNLFWVALLLIPAASFSQANTNRVSGQIIDAKTKEPISYANIFEELSKRGTVSNLEGKFRLNQLPENWNLTISYLGYQDFNLNAQSFPENGIIQLKERPELLEEVVVYGENELLYKLVSKSKRTLAKKSKVAKSYFLLETNKGKEQLELIESYYNGFYQGYEVNQLNLKNGRIALSPYGERFFLSTATSKGIIFQKITQTSPVFPQNPIGLSRRRLKRYFELKLASKYKNDQESTIFVIHYFPKVNNGKAFEGKIWIDSTSNKIQKITLNCENAKIYPFKPIGHNDELLRMDFQLAKTFQEIEDEMYVQSIDFIYDLAYRTDADSIINISTTAVLYAYNYEDKFIEPFFDIRVNRYVDYQKINGSMYNSFFWDNHQEFRVNEKKAERDQFLAESMMQSDANMFQRNNFFDVGLLEFPYVLWDTLRIRFRENLKADTTQDLTGKNFKSDFYDLHVQLYMDINEFQDSIHIITGAIFDPYQSYFYYKATPGATAFINMYFDLMEIQRRLLVQEIAEGERTVKRIKSLYRDRLNKVQNVKYQFFNDVNRGKNEKGMRKWNKIIKKHLGIDNVKLFGLFQDEG